MARITVTTSYSSCYPLEQLFSMILDIIFILLIATGGTPGFSLIETLVIGSVEVENCSSAQ